MAISLFVTRGNEKGQVYDITSGKVTVGRDLQNGICLTDLETSRQHCQIAFAGDTFHVTDLASSNGTYLNGNSVASSTLKIGDQINVGQTVFVVMAPNDVSSADNTKPPHPQISSDVSVETPVPSDDRFVSQMKSNLQFMYDASMATSRKKIGPMTDDILSLIFEWVTADRGCILLRDGPRKPLQVRSMKHRDPAKADTRFKISRSIASHVDDNSIGVLSTDLHTSEKLKNSQSALDPRISEVLCVPIRGRSFGLGLIYIDRIAEAGVHEQSFNEDHLKLMHVIAHQAAIAIENEEYYSALLEKERMLAIGETAEKLSHRIKNILQSINGGTHIVETGMAQESFEQINQGWRIVKRNQERMSKLVLEMLLVNNEYIPDRQDTNINQLISAVIDEYRAKAAAMHVKIDFSQKSDQPIVNVDEKGITSAIGYAVDEAVKNSRGVENASVTVVMTSTAQRVEILVKSAVADVEAQDSEPHASEIFSAAKEFFPGLELSAAKKILRGHQGNLEINNEITHEEYRLWFPASSSDANAQQTVLRRSEASTLTLD